MANAPKSKSKAGQANADAWDAIAAFEQILDAIPNDHVALEALVNAYEMVGEQAKACNYIVKLGNLLVEQGDIEAALALVDKLKQFGKANPEAVKTIALIEEARLNRTALVPPTAKTQATALPDATPVVREKIEVVKRTSNVADELSFAWHMLQSKIITQDEYSTVAQDLTEMSAGEAKVTVSVLHVLHDRGLRNLEAVIAFSAKDTGTPAVSLSVFDLQKSVVTLLPLDFSIQRGVLVFEVLGATALVALLNPYNTKLREDVKALLEQKCHFFITLPSDFDNAISKFKSFLEAPAEKI